MLAHAYWYNLHYMDRHELASRGGKARADRLTPARRSEIARHAAATRWRKAPPTIDHDGNLAALADALQGVPGAEWWIPQIEKLRAFIGQKPMK